jgi:hypothetical protein
MAKKTKTAPLTFAEYQRLHNVIHSLSENWENEAGRSCVFFSITGAALMHKHYHLNAKVICGSGAVRLDEKTETALSWFSHNKDGTVTTGSEAFHTWIECDGWLIDLMAPNYREALTSATLQHENSERHSAAPNDVPRMMLQKLTAQTEGELDDMKKPGDCVFVPDQEVTTSVINNAFDSVQFGDIIAIAYAWHRPCPQKMEQSITITDNFGEITTIKLIKRELTGKW